MHRTILNLTAAGGLDHTRIVVAGGRGIKKTVTRRTLVPTFPILLICAQYILPVMMHHLSTAIRKIKMTNQMELQAHNR